MGVKLTVVCIHFWFKWTLYECCAQGGISLMGSTKSNYLINSWRVMRALKWCVASRTPFWRTASLQMHLSFRFDYYILSSKLCWPLLNVNITIVKLIKQQQQHNIRWLLLSNKAIFPSFWKDIIVLKQFRSLESHIR